ncbi:hypothetical protein EUGRSUZ_G01550 [Eucalyptus grandis]|uniref:Uncharacterized protein n=2 Tax=Eucalyptus grandis TaxID=71139 RepID=A0ACC3K3X6_EUCGR|nr:hypothetical protein EUGRSUZ_G01550 [Eucalyptus grandis]
MGAVIIPRNLPVGYGFRPTDEELVDHYLKLKVQGFTGVNCIIPEVDICKWEPWELPKIFEEQSIIPPDDKVQEWWFFYLQTPRIQRSTPLGFWKKTGVDRPIKAGDRNREIGTKKTLVFHRGHGKRAIGTKWVIHEYHLLTNNLNELFPHAPTKSYVVCHLKHKGNEESDFSAQQLNGRAISSMDLDSGLHQPEHNNSFPETWSEAVGNSSISLDDLDSNLHQPEHENLFPEPSIQAVENSSISLVDLQSDLRQPEPENSCPENWQTPTIETLHGQTSSSQNKNAMEETGQTLAIELPHGCREVPPEEKKSFDGNESNCSNVFPPKRMDPLEEPATVRIYSKGEKMRFLEVKKQELAAKNMKPNCPLLDNSATKAKHDQASRFHKGSILEENWLTSTKKSLDGVLKGKKGFTESELDGWEIVSAKQTEHPKKAGNAGISCKYKDPRLEKLKMPEFSAREISNQKVHLWLNQKLDQRGESNEHREETEPAREISISATPSAGSTSNHAKISANSSTFKITTRFMPW